MKSKLKVVHIAKTPSIDQEFYDKVLAHLKKLSRERAERRTGKVGRGHVPAS